MTKTATIRQPFTPGLHLQAVAMDGETPHPEDHRQRMTKAASIGRLTSFKTSEDDKGRVDDKTLHPDDDRRQNKIIYLCL